MIQLKQRNFLTTRIYKLTDFGLDIYSKDLFNRANEKVKFEEIGASRQVINFYYKQILYPSIFFTLIGIFRALVFIGDSSDSLDSVGFWTTMGIIGLIFSYLTRRKELFLQSPGQTQIKFYYIKPTTEEFNEFINHLIAKRDKLLKMKYGNINSKLDYEIQHERLLWLNSIDVISNKELESKKKELDKLYSLDGGSFDINLN